MNSEIIIIQLIIFIAFVSYNIIKYGVQTSISNYWYVGNDLEKIAFTLLFTYALGITQFFSGSIWFALSGSFLVFVGAAPNFKSEWSTTERVHVIGAMGSILFGLIGLLFLKIWWPLIPVLLSIPLFHKIKNKTFWIEIVCFFAIIGGKISTLSW